ncbi:MAG: DUF4145 domain-containing protein [Verrucomicrobia bacterium]|nr:DUF4145 domain-containing protein [Verrucomicrobiota bacterium]MDA1065438.1 DUF4145 domain-containing protein [Verrucomicrobiota bacterium]
MESNFEFLSKEFPQLYEAGKKAEGYAYTDARSACIYARLALEIAVQWLYEHDSQLELPYDTKLGSLIHGSKFREVVPEQIFHKAKVIQQAGNLAVHNSRRPVKQWEAQQVVKELFHSLYWLARTYHRQGLAEVKEFEVGLIPQEAVAADEDLSGPKLAALEAELAKKAKLLADKEAEIDEKHKQLQLRISAARRANEAKPDTHDYSEADTRKYLIDLELARAGWTLENKEDKEYPVQGMPTNSGEGFADYVLWGYDGKPLGLVEAKRTTKDAAVGKQQAKLYADCLEQMHGQRPVIFYTNGYKINIWDDTAYPPREVAGYHNREELELMIQLT